MKKFDRVYFPDPDGKYDLEEVGAGWVDSLSLYLAPANSTIVCTIEQLKEMWNTAMERRDRDVWMRDIGEDNYNTAPTFEEYLTEQGITI